MIRWGLPDMLRCTAPFDRALRRARPDNQATVTGLATLIGRDNERRV